MKCRICGCEQNHKTYIIKEKMLGLEDKFLYFLCNDCGCLQIDNIPDDMAMYYPSGYYSYDFVKGKKRIKDTMRLLANKIAFRTHLGHVSKLSNYLRPPIRALVGLSPSLNSRILDVGCGSGWLLNQLIEVGFNNLLGVDPYLENDIDYQNGLKIVKKQLGEIEGIWDVIMFHHSFEHIADQQAVLSTVSKLLASGGRCLIRIPIVSSYAWSRYGENWVQIDAPRHFYLHSIESMKVLAENTGYIVESVSYDSTAFQFWGSELYEQNINLVSENGTALSNRNKYFSKKEIKAFESSARRLNKSGEGDQAAFIIRKS